MYEVVSKGIVNGVKVEWDNNKHNINLKKHGLDFNDAVELLKDKEYVSKVDIKHSNKDETRLNIIGEIDDLIFHLTFTYRDDYIRLISFRKASKKERREYYDKKK